LAPLRRASESPIAIACLRLFTLRPLPDFSLPLFNLCITFFTFCPAFGLYFRRLERERLLDDRLRDELLRDRAEAERFRRPELLDLLRERAEERGRLEREERDREEPEERDLELRER
jgi:hypothetical protein